MKMLLTSGGLTNSSIRAELVALLGKPIEESSALLIPTAQWGHPYCTPEITWKTIAGKWEGESGFCIHDWKSVGVLELTAIPSMAGDRWVPWVREADVLLADGGEAVYLAHWMRESGLAGMIPSLEDTVWVGMSGGSMVMTPRIGHQFVAWQPDESDECLGIVDFSIFPHLNYPGWSSNTLEAAHRWAEDIQGPAYAVDDQTAISVVDGEVTVISEGEWELLNQDTGS